MFSCFVLRAIGQVQSPHDIKYPNTSTQTKENPYGSMMGGHADQVKKGASSNSIHGLPADIKSENKVLTPTSSIPNKQQASMQLVKSILNEVHTTEKAVSYKLPSLKSMPGILNFEAAYNELVQMLEGKKELDLKRAVFLSEDAFFGNQMKYEDYKKSVQEMALLIQMHMSKKGLPTNNTDAINYMTYEYMTDTLQLPVTWQEKTLTTYPKTYDFDDPFGYEDPAHLFVTKLMMENSGQCKSLPLLYLILIEALGGEAYLSLSPNHSYIKCKSEKGVWYNIELTNGMLTSDSWVVGSGYVKAEAVKSGIYLDTLNKKQVIANCLVDLAQYYSYRYGGYDEFVLKCVNKALEYHSTNINAIQVKSDYYTMLMQHVAQQVKAPTPQHLKGNKEAMKVYEQMNKLYALLDDLGFENMPEQVYKDWLNTLKEKKQQQDSQVKMIRFSNGLLTY